MASPCPTTQFFLKMRDKFHRGLEDIESCSKKSCAPSCFTGKISEMIHRKLEKDQSFQEDMRRGLIRDLSILFADIRGFTTRTAMMHPERIIRLLDLFIPEMLSIIIERHQGTVDKLLGDGILAVYGHPYQTGREIMQAVYSAIDMQQAASAMEEVLRVSGFDPIAIGVGINHGEVLICEVGNDNYRESTVIGAPVNVAAKMEDIAGANEIAMPAAVIPLLEGINPRIAAHFRELGTRHGVDAVALNWAEFIEKEGPDMPDWSIR
jgi:class 3 adenylate cyclase